MRRKGGRTGAARIFRDVLGNKDIRRVLVAYAGFSTTEWATWIAILVYAYDIGGATAAGVIAFIQLVPAALFAPFASSFFDRYPRERALSAGYGIQFAAITATGLALALDAPSVVVYLLAGVDAASVTLTRPIQAALMPLLAKSPEELTAANVVASGIESTAMLVGPVVAGVLFGVGDAALIYIAMAALMLLSTLASLRIRPTRSIVEDRSSVWTETGEGIRYVARDPEARLLVGLSGGHYLQVGAIDVLIVVLGISLLMAGESGVGFLNAIFGVGGLMGASVAVVLVGRRRLAPALIAGALVFALSLAFLGAVSTPVAAVMLLIVCGSGRIVMDVSTRTLLQRVVPNQMLGRIFGLLEGLSMGALALGSILVPALIALGDERTPFFVVGTGLSIVVLLCWRPMARVDARAHVPERELALLRAIPIFSPLPGPVIERLASSMERLAILDDHVVVSLGDQAEHFFVIAEGEFDVSKNQLVVATLGPGDFFGEIALLRDIPRTASVTATTKGIVYTLGRDEFIEAVTGFAPSRAAAEEIAARRSPRTAE